jgi:hypothetical protein
MVAGRYACQCDTYGGLQGDGVTARDGSDGRIVSLRSFPSSLPCPRGPLRSNQSNPKGKLVKVSDVRTYSSPVPLARLSLCRARAAQSCTSDDARPVAACVIDRRRPGQGNTAMAVPPTYVSHATASGVRRAWPYP